MIWPFKWSENRKYKAQARASALHVLSAWSSCPAVVREYIEAGKWWLRWRAWRLVNQHIERDIAQDRAFQYPSGKTASHVDFERAAEAAAMLSALNACWASGKNAERGAECAKHFAEDAEQFWKWATE